jgi:hypothetical protein
MMRAIDDMVKDPTAIGILPTEEGTFPYGSRDLGRPALPTIEASFETLPEIPRLYTPFGDEYMRPSDYHGGVDKYWEAIDDMTKIILDSLSSASAGEPRTVDEYDAKVAETRTATGAWGHERLPESTAIYHPDFDTEGYLKIYEERSDRESKAYEAEKLAEDLAWSAARDERLDVPDVRTYIPAAGREVDSSLVDSIISTASAGGTPGLAEALVAAEREGYKKEGIETSTPLTDLALLTVGGGTLGALGSLGGKLYKSAKLLTGKLPGTAVPSKVYKEAIKATEAGLTGPGKVLGAPVGERKGILGGILGHLSKDVDVLSSLAMGSGSAGKLAYRISDSTKKGVLSKVAKDLYGEATDVTRKRVVATLRREIGDTHDLSTGEKVTTYLTAMLKSSGGKVGEYARKVDGVDSFADLGVRRAMTGVGKETFGSLPRAVGLGATGGAIGGAYLGGAGDVAFGSTDTPYTDPYPGMIDPTYVAPITPVDDFSSMPIPSGAYTPPPSYDFDDDPYVPGVYDPVTGATDYITYAPPSGIPSYMEKDISGVWHDTRRFTDLPPGYDWRTGLGAGDAGGGGSISAASMSDDDRLAEALERLASIPAGFVGGPEREITYTDATGGRITPFGGVGDIGGGSGTITSPLTGRGGFYAPIGMPSPVYSYTDPGLATGMGGLGGLWT